MNLTCECAVRPYSPPLGTPELFELVAARDLLLAPGGIRGNAKPLANDAIDFVAEKQLVLRELCLRVQRRDGFIANFEERSAGDRVLVDLDLILNVEIVFVLQRSW